VGCAGINHAGDGCGEQRTAEVGCNTAIHRRQPLLVARV